MVTIIADGRRDQNNVIDVVRLRRRADGKTVLSMTVRGTTELTRWILGLGPYVEVLRPAALRDEIRQSLAQAARLYG